MEMGEQSLQELKDRGKAALKDKDLDLAIECFSEVLKISQDAETFLERARAYRKQKSSLLEAAEDAKHACRLDPTRAAGYVEQGKILYELEEYESAKKCFETALTLEPGKKLVQNWLGMCCVALGEKVPESSPKGDEEHRVIETKGDAYTDSSGKVGPSRVTIDDEEYRKYWSMDKATQQVGQVPVAPRRFDHSWFQSPTGVEVDILAKNVNPENVHVEFSTDSIKVQVQHAGLKQGEPEYSKRFDLFGQIDPAESTYQVLKTKIEIKARKKDTSVQWSFLEKSSVPSMAVGAPSSDQAASSDQKGKGTKDWSKIEKQIAGDEEEESNVLNFFQKLYAGADEDTRRAMMKSYQESGGTSLSTNWKDVSSRDFSKEND